jgi:diguanylate cyclase (GGDEF)-like protein
MNQRLLTASHTDHLTRLRNRRSMSLHLRELGVAREQTALLLLDIDDFKLVNDQYGHDIGDEVLVAYAQRLLDHAGSAAKVARWGGQEFLIALPGLDATGAQAVADAVQHRLSAPIDTRKGALTVKVSIGIANLPLNGIRSETAWHHSLQLADAALYRAKRLGRSMWVCYWLDRPVSGWSPERVASETELAHSTGVLQARTSRVPDRPVETASSSPAH